ncbi:MAG TPA: hypothetical protein VM888_02050, partial [Chitinophagaceae bacterium]|nr:hypothetical protein [Chitinophagaceae bacterium]
MKRTILTFLSIAGSIVLFAQDPMSTSRAADLSGRTAARDMNKIVTPPALPVLNTFVEPEVMTRTTGSYGQKLYSITQVKDAMGETAYQVTLLENGQTKSEWITESGTAVVNMFRTPETDSLVALRDRNRADSMNNAMNANNSMNTMNNTNAGNNTMNNTNTTNQNTTTTTTNSTTTTTTDSTNMQNNTNMTTDTTSRMNNSTNMNNTQLNS